MVCYFSPLFGAMLADGWLGKYRTILYMSLFYGIGNAVLALTAIPPSEIPGPIVALLIIGVGTGANVSCFGKDCYLLAFGLPAILMFLSIILFFAGGNYYKKFPPSGNVIGQLISISWRGFRNRIRGKQEGKKHWLDYAEDKYEPELISDVKAVLRVGFLFLPLPIFWALYDQQGSRWTFQAARMNLSLGPLGNLKPDQIQAINASLILMFIPFFDLVIYPLLDKLKIPNRPLQRMCSGMLLAAVAFFAAGFLEIHLQKSLPPKIPNNQTNVRFINTAPCSISINGISSEPFNMTGGINNVSFLAKKMLRDAFLPAGNYSMIIEAAPACKAAESRFSSMFEGGERYYVIIGKNDSQSLAKSFLQSKEKPKDGGAVVKIIVFDFKVNPETEVILEKNSQMDQFNVTAFEPSPNREIQPGEHKIRIYGLDNETIIIPESINLRNGGAYTILLFRSMLNESDNKMIAEVHTDLEPNELSIGWQVPQYVIITAAEILFSITGLSFAYSQAPSSMKSVVQALWLSATAFGNLIVTIVAEGKFFENQAVEFFFFAFVMIFVTLLFGTLAYFYKYVSYDQIESERHELLDSTKGD
ncbi:DgyrCDS10998 [Dimorphilus gyrociliatus]|uniref:DgyrCDS10998 n=1 Tax=Dimorphilus gyrociliatus TaxID=2664684 RepID=A0A7I8W215_9ANNE|nr:DgyrCDS10998 [Dimorphilus gyrociliatus]